MATQAQQIEELRAEIQTLKGMISPQAQFLSSFEDHLATMIDLEIVESLGDQKGPLGGTSQQLRAIFTDAKGKQHGVLVNAYVGEPDVVLGGEDGKQVVRGGSVEGQRRY
jgi:hypothetical protein